MPLKGHQQKFLDLFLDQELTLSKVYEMFSERFPEHRDFWETISKEELEHAQWVRYLRGCIEDGRIRFNESNTGIMTIISSISMLKEALPRIGSKEFTIHNALSIAIDAEKSIVEREVFKTFEGNEEEIKKVLTILRDGSAGHMERIEKFSSKIGRI